MTDLTGTESLIYRGGDIYPTTVCTLNNNLSKKKVS